jgi:hypothetical protein
MSRDGGLMAVKLQTTAAMLLSSRNVTPVLNFICKIRNSSHVSQSFIAITTLDVPQIGATGG